MARTEPNKVQKVLGGDYDWVVAPDLTPYIEAANSIVSQVSACAARKGRTVDAVTLELIERWLAAHYYTKQDPVYTTRSTQGASGAFVRDPSEPEPYKSAAIDLDPSGCLNAILKRQRASVTWVGKPPSSQIPVEERS